MASRTSRKPPGAPLKRANERAHHPSGSRRSTDAPSNVLYRARAPLRISFCGGGTDVDPYPAEKGGAVLSTTIDKFAWATLKPRKDARMSIHSSTTTWWPTIT
jgi:hypothetical protein